MGGWAGCGTQQPESKALLSAAPQQQSRHASFCNASMAPHHRQHQHTHIHARPPLLSQFGGAGGYKNAEDYPAAPNIDHSQVGGWVGGYARILRSGCGTCPTPPHPRSNKHERGQQGIAGCMLRPCPALTHHRKSPPHPTPPHPQIKQERVRQDISEWMRYLKNSIGFDGWRFDYVKG